LFLIYFCWYYYWQIKNGAIPSPGGPVAVELRRRARRLLVRFHLPDDALPGSLAGAFIMLTTIDADKAAVPATARATFFATLSLTTIL
jgi:hypothetical protein